MTETIAPGSFVAQVQATEATVLGAILKDPDVIPSFSGTLHSEYFRDPNNKAICDAILELEAEACQIDIMTVFQKASIVDASYIAGLTEKAPIAQNLNFYAEKLVNNYMVMRTQGILQASLQLGPNIELDRIISELQTIQELKVKSEDDAMDWGEVSRKIVEKMDSDEPMREGYLPQSSFPALDSVAPLHKGELCIIGAIESGGKTAFAVNLCLGLARKGSRGMYFFYESTPENLQFRIASITTKIPMQRILSRNLSDKERGVIRERLLEFGDELLYKDKSQKGAIQDLTGYVRAKIKKYPCDYIVIDHMHQMPVAGKIREGFIDISRKLLALAKQENICVIALAQFRKPGVTEFDKRPNRTMIRESSSIAQDAHHIWFLHDPQYLADKRAEQQSPTEKFNDKFKTRGGQDDIPEGPKHAEIIVDKKRKTF
jgi:replicative DNA helicase